MSGAKDPSSAKQSSQEKGAEFAIELQPTNKNAGGAKADDIFGSASAEQNIPKKAPPKNQEAAGAPGNNSGEDGFENKYDDQTKKKVTKKKKKTV